jgi:hypothetical protein
MEDRFQLHAVPNAERFVDVGPAVLVADGRRSGHRAAGDPLIGASNDEEPVQSVWR